MDGVGVCVRNYARWLARSGSEPHVIVPSSPNYEDDTDFDVLRFRSVKLPAMAPYRAGLPGLDPEFLKRVYSLPFDLVHAHCPFVSGSIGLKIARKRKIPIIATFHSKYREDLRKALYFEKTADLALSYIIRFYEAADVVWVPSTSTAQTLQEYGYEGPSEVMPNGSDMPLPTEDEYARFREEGRRLAEVDKSEYLFLFVGQHRWEKNVRLIIEAMRALSESKVSFRMVFAGSGYAEKEMKKLVSQYRISDRVRFMGTISDRADLQRLYAAADLFLFPSLYDNVPLVVREAAAFRLPAVLAAHSSAAEGVVDGENGFLTENNLDRFVEKLRAVMESPQLRDHAGNGALDTIYVSWQEVVRRVTKRYSEIIEDFR
ncbi:MAG TPA: glycosyltransferase [Spirochaetia bacterium]|nr:glycosyltransferase [Spirochaetia bacterium]